MKSGFYIVLLLALISSCSGESEQPEYVVRLGDRFLTRDEINASLESLTVLQDSADASRQIVEQWITNELLFNEAVRRGIRNDEDVRRLLEENERSVMVSALLSRLYKEDQSAPDEQALISYYEQNKERLKLTEQFVRVRYLVVDSPDSAVAAVELMQTIDAESNADSIWQITAERYSNDPETTSLLSSSYYPESRIFSSIPGLNEAIGQLSDGQILSPFEMDGQYHVVQLVQRLPVGAIPEMPLLEDQLRARIAIENRKQLYARQVQRLRNEALAREELIVR